MSQFIEWLLNAIALAVTMITIATIGVFSLIMAVEFSGINNIGFLFLFLVCCASYIGIVCLFWENIKMGHMYD